MDGPTRNGIQNFMVSINGSAFFLKSLDCTIHLRDGVSKDAGFIADQLIGCIREFRAVNVVQVIMDGDGANRAAWPMIEAEYPHIVCSWCAAHVLDLLLADIGKLDIFLAGETPWKQLELGVVSTAHWYAMPRTLIRGGPSSGKLE
mmetsp:Transcript_60628/g.161885  ORF Transcript_60628/g.161885 Transcript_60628/m.161885 type:complete len:146 (-) Transcript_60628:296-733(-)